MINQEDVTIIIPHLGATEAQRYALGQCLTSLLETCECKIIVVKNGPSSQPYVSPEQRVVGICIEEQGQCKAVNAAVATVSTPWVLVTNDDMVYAPGWFEELVKYMGPDILCASPKLVEPTPGAPTFETYFCGGAGGDFDKQKFYEYAKHRVYTDWTHGFNLPFLIKKELWDLVGGYDVNYDPWGSNSDSDLEYKIKLAGVQPMQNGNVVVYHFSQTSGTFSPEHQDAWQKNWQYFIDKWGFLRAESPEIWTAEFKIPENNQFHPFWEGHYGH